jgi:hypothetical protein
VVVQVEASTRSGIVVAADVAQCLSLRLIDWRELCPPRGSLGTSIVSAFVHGSRPPLKQLLSS